ncbi:chymotrypsin-like elastase family member 2A [Planococcus citri]|uniref:chymotrypsin-like elastase family member 2A n=1 Tax=Planococcus citri TaxID=170843 RepID=UPI0031F9783E
MLRYAHNLLSANRFVFLIFSAYFIVDVVRCFHLAPHFNQDCGVTNGVAARQPRVLNSPFYDDISNEFEERSEPINSTKYNQVPRLINGKETQPGAWPWQVSLQLLHPKFGLIKHWCGGVLILPSWILTAAHCIHNDLFSLQLAALWTAVLGEWDRDLDENTEIRIPIENIFVHEHFNNFQHDIALLKLSRATGRYDKGIGTVCLPSGGELSAPSICIATGWGKTSPKGQLSSTLRQIRVPLHNNTVCKAKYGSTIPIQSSHLCGGKLDGKFGACIGDSGGPLQCTLKDGRWFLAGITSFGSGCAKPGYPDVYTKLSFYMPWIKNQIDKYSRTNL